MDLDIGIKVGSVLGVIGPPEYIDRFCSLVIDKLETGDKRFSMVVSGLRQKEIKREDVSPAIEELRCIKNEFSHLLETGQIHESAIQTASGRLMVDVLLEYLSFAAEENLGAILELCQRRSRNVPTGSVVVTFGSKPEG